MKFIANTSSLVEHLQKISGKKISTGALAVSKEYLMNLKSLWDNFKILVIFQCILSSYRSGLIHFCVRPSKYEELNKFAP